MKTCPACSTKVHDDTTGCPECGGRWCEDGSFQPPPGIGALKPKAPARAPRGLRRVRLPIIGDLSLRVLAAPAFIAALALAVANVVVWVLYAVHVPSDASASERGSAGLMLAGFLLLTAPAMVAFLDAGAALYLGHLRVRTWLHVTLLLALGCLPLSVFWYWSGFSLFPGRRVWMWAILLFFVADVLWLMFVGWMLVLREHRDGSLSAPASSDAGKVLPIS